MIAAFHSPWDWGTLPTSGQTHTQVKTLLSPNPLRKVNTTCVLACSCQLYLRLTLVTVSALQKKISCQIPNILSRWQTVLSSNGYEMTEKRCIKTILQHVYCLMTDYINQLYLVFGNKYLSDF